VKFKCEGSPSDQVLYLYRRARTWNNERLMQLRERVREKDRGREIAGEISPSVGLHHNDIICVEKAYVRLCFCAIRSTKASLLCSSLWSYIKLEVILESGFSPAC